jgi:hypothetical protein
LPLIVRCTDLYLEGYRDDNPPDMRDIVDYQIVLDIEDMVRLGLRMPKPNHWIVLAIVLCAYLLAGYYDSMDY